MKTTWWLSLVGLAFLMSTPAHSAQLEGTLRVVVDAPASEDAPLGYWRVWNGVVGPLKKKTRAAINAAVVLTGESGGDAKACQLRLSNGGLQSQTVVGPRGKSLSIVNNDGTEHQIQLKGLSGFSSLPIAAGNSGQATLNGTGPWPVRDALYPHISGYVHALDKVVECGRIAGDGSFVFENIAAGQYTIHVFYGDKEVHQKAIEVGEKDMRVPSITVKLKNQKAGK